MNGSIGLRIRCFLAVGLLAASHVVTAASPANGPDGGKKVQQSRAVTTTQIQPSLNPSMQGQAVTLAVTVTGAAPTGTITFKQSNIIRSSEAAEIPPPGTIGSCEAVPLSGGSAQCTIVFNTPGTWDITALYSGDAANEPSAGMIAGGQVVQSMWPSLIVRKLGSGFVIGPGIGCGADCRDFYPPGSTVTLIANPNGNSGFKRWIGCDLAQGGNCTLTVQNERTVTAEFESESAPSNDFNDDGRGDIVWRDGGKNFGDSAIWLMHGTGTPSIATVASNSAYRVTHVGDFNGDGKSDLIWRRDTAGDVSLTLMDGTTITSRAIILPPGTGYAVKHVGDFNGDGRSDILWQGANGSVGIWLMDGVNPQSGAFLLPAGTDWSPALVGDFNADGRTDILWQHTNGAAAIWLMDGLGVQSGGLIRAAATGYVAQHLGDFDGNGRADIVWKGEDGSYDLWLMDGLAVAQSGTILTGGTGSNVVHVADFDGDRRSDLVFQKDDGTVAVWQMSGLGFTNVTTFLGAGRAVKHARDFSGDGKADLLWAHGDGSYVLWILDGGTVIESKILREPGNTYQAGP